MLVTFSFTSSKTSILLHQKHHIQQINYVTKFSRKSYFIIDNFYVIFDEKYFKKSVNIIQKRVSTSFFQQMRIIAYFKLIMTYSINQKSINSKISTKFNSFKNELFKINDNSTSRISMSLISKKKIQNICISFFRQIFFIFLIFVAFVVQLSYTTMIYIVIFELIICERNLRNFNL